MLQLLIDLIAARLRYEPVPVELLNVLAMVCSDCLFVMLTVMFFNLLQIRVDCSQIRNT